MIDAVLDPQVAPIIPRVDGHTTTRPLPSGANGSAVGRKCQAALSRKSKVRITLEMQDQLYKDVMDPKTDPATRASLARAWDVLEERIRIIRGKLKPGSINSTRAPEPVKRTKVRSSRDVVRQMQEEQAAQPSDPTATS